MTMWADSNLSQVRKVPGFDQQSTQPQHFQALADRLRHSCAFYDHVSAASMRRLTDELEPLGFAGGGGIQHQIRSHALRERQPKIREIDSNDGSRSQHSSF